MTPIPDVTKFVFCCLVCPWQVQVSQRARSEHGGAIGMYRAVAEVTQEHIVAEHPAWKPADTIGDHAKMKDGGEATGGVMAMALPRWWVDR